MRTRAHPDPEFMELFCRYQKGGYDGKRAMEEIIRRHTPFVMRTVRRYAVHDDLREALIVAGKLGIFEAVQRFDPERGVKFLSYAGYWVAVRVGKAYAKESGLIWIQPEQRTLAKRVKNAIEDHHLRYQRLPSDQELAEITGLTNVQVQRCRQELPHCHLVTDLFSEHQSVEWLEIAMRGQEETEVLTTEEQVLLKLQVEAIVALAKNHLKPTHYEVFAHVYGLVPGLPAMSLAETAQCLKRNKHQVTAQYRKAIVTLRRLCA